jgi:hypothetical protein
MKSTPGRIVVNHDWRCDLYPTIRARASSEGVMKISDEEFLCGVCQLCPFSVDTFPNGDGLLRDGAFRAIAWLRPDGWADIITGDDFYDFDPGTEPIETTFLHHDFGLPLGKRACEIVKEFIEIWGLAPELQRRRELLRLGELPSPVDKLAEKWAFAKSELSFYAKRRDDFYFTYSTRTQASVATGAI